MLVPCNLCGFAPRIIFTAVKPSVRESIKPPTQDITSHSGACRNITIQNATHITRQCQHITTTQIATHTITTTTHVTTQSGACQKGKTFCKPHIWQLRQASIEPRFSFDQSQYNNPPGGPQQARPQNIISRYIRWQWVKKNYNRRALAPVIALEKSFMHCNALERNSTLKVPKALGDKQSHVFRIQKSCTFTCCRDDTCPKYQFPFQYWQAHKKLQTQTRYKCLLHLSNISSCHKRLLYSIR